MGMAAARRSRPEITGMRAAFAHPVHVVGVGFDIVVGVGVEMLAAPAANSARPESCGTCAESRRP